MAKRYEIHMLVNAGRPNVGRWAPLPYHFDNEPEALRLVEWMRDRDRWACGLASSYRIVEKPEVTVDQICAELDGFMAEMQAKQGAR
jgi:hypothetical protein